MYYTEDEMFLYDSVGTFDWNAEKELTYADSTVKMDDTDTRLIDILGNFDKLQKAIELADNIEGRAVSNKKIKGLKEVQGLRFAVPVNGDEDNIAIFEIKAVEDIPRTGFNGAIVKCVKGGGAYNGKTIAWADGSKGWGNLFKIQSPIALAKVIRELWNDWFVNDFGQIARNNPFNQLHDLIKFIQVYNDKYKKDPITIGVGASMQGIGMSICSYVKGFEDITFKSYSGCVSKKMLENMRAKLSKMSAKKKPEWELNPSSNGKLEVYTNMAEPLTKALPPVQENNQIYLMKDCQKKGLGGHGGPAYHSSDKKPVEYYVSTHAKNSKNAEQPAVHKKPKGSPTGGAAPVKTEGSKTSTGSNKKDEDGHWITTKKGNHVFIEDEDDALVPWGQCGIPEVYFSNHSPEYWEVQNDPEIIAYRNRGKRK